MFLMNNFEIATQLNGNNGEYTNGDDVECWNCEGDHLLADCKVKRNNKIINKNRKKTNKLPKPKPKEEKEEEIEEEEELETQVIEFGLSRRREDAEDWQFKYPNDYYRNSDYDLGKLLIWFYCFCSLVRMFGAKLLVGKVTVADTPSIIFDVYWALFAPVDREHIETLFIVTIGIAIMFVHFMLIIYYAIKFRQQPIEFYRYVIGQLTDMKWGKVTFKEWVDYDRFVPSCDARPDSHAQGKIIHIDPLAAWVTVEYFTLSKFLVPRRRTDVMMISFEALAQFLSSERIVFTANVADNYERMKRAMRNLSTIDYDRFFFLDTYLETPTQTGEDLLGNTVNVAMLWMIANNLRNQGVFGRVARATLN